MDLSERYTWAREMATRTSRAIVERARREAKAAGLDPSMPFLAAHNALVSQHYGRPWREVDYDKARLVLHLERVSWRPHRLLDGWTARMDKEHGPSWLMPGGRQR